MMLEKTLSELHGYRGWMIGKCRFSFGGEEKPAEAPGPLQQSCHLDVLRSDRRLAEVEITNPLTGDQLRVMLVRAFPKMKSGTEKAADEAAGQQKLDTEPGDGRTAEAGYRTGGRPDSSGEPAAHESRISSENRRSIPANIRGNKHVSARF